jgi:hypothetical protein
MILSSITWRALDNIIPIKKIMPYSGDKSNSDGSDLNMR